MFVRTYGTYGTNVNTFSWSRNNGDNYDSSMMLHYINTYVCRYVGRYWMTVELFYDIYDVRCQMCLQKSRINCLVTNIMMMTNNY